MTSIFNDCGENHADSKSDTAITRKSVISRFDMSFSANN